MTTSEGHPAKGVASVPSQAEDKAGRGVRTRERRFTLARQQRIWGWIFLSPWIIGFLAFTLFPMIVSLMFSFMHYDQTKPDEIGFLGWDHLFDNYIRLTTDPTVGQALSNTIRFGLVALPLSILVPLGLAALLNVKNLWGKRLLRTLFYMPYMVPVVSSVYIWNGFLNTQTGWLNRILESIGIPGPNWLYSVDWIYPALFIVGLWGVGNAMLTMLAGMQAVPTELYEAARVDGAGPVRAFWKITVPMISPVIFYNLILALIGIFRYFDIPYILTNGNGQPGGATNFYNIYFYKTTFKFFDLGYGAALAWVLFIIALIVTIAVFASARYWVYYAGDGR